MGGQGGKKKMVKAKPVVARSAKPTASKRMSKRQPAEEPAAATCSDSEGEADVPSTQPMTLDERTTAQIKHAVTQHHSAVTESRPKRAAAKKTGTVIYLGHIPHGFYEEQMRGFFSQFGHINRLRLARNRKTGRSKHYAFIEFEHEEVAKIISKAMNGYLLYSKVLVCEVVKPENVHPDTFKHSNPPPEKPRDRLKKERRRHNKLRTPEEAATRVKGLLRKDRVKRKKLEAAGIEYEFGGYAEAASKHRKTVPEDEQPSLEEHA